MLNDLGLNQSSSPPLLSFLNTLILSSSISNMFSVVLSFSFIAIYWPELNNHNYDLCLQPGGYSGRVPELGRCFFLVDLWNHFYPLSAYGVGTPVRLPSGQEIEQYFVPYLSAIQLHTISDFTSCK